jgi:carbon storage regulator
MEDPTVLSFTRKIGQTIRIGESIQVTIVEVRGRRVRLQVQAPREIQVFREELYAQITEENARAAAANLAALEALT